MGFFWLGFLLLRCRTLGTLDLSTQATICEFKQMKQTQFTINHQNEKFLAVFPRNELDPIQNYTQMEQGNTQNSIQGTVLTPIRDRRGSGVGPKQGSKRPRNLTFSFFCFFCNPPKDQKQDCKPKEPQALNPTTCPLSLSLSLYKLKKNKRSL